jgi:hypothetical protein
MTILTILHRLCSRKWAIPYVVRLFKRRRGLLCTSWCKRMADGHQRNCPCLASDLISQWVRSACEF